MDDLLFDIPIYLRSCEEYERERQSADKKRRESLRVELDCGKKIEDLRWPPWKYNDIIGYYKIIINSSAHQAGSINGVRVEKYSAENKRIIRDPRQRRKVEIWLSDPWFHKKLPNQQGDPKSTLLMVLDALYKDTKGGSGRKKRCYIDAEYYKHLVECLDLKKYELVSKEMNGG